MQRKRLLLSYSLFDQKNSYFLVTRLRILDQVIAINFLFLMANPSINAATRCIIYQLSFLGFYRNNFFPFFPQVMRHIKLTIISCTTLSLKKKKEYFQV